MTHICVGKLTIIGSDNGSSPERRQAIIWTNAGILLIGPLGTNFSEILIEIQTFSLKKITLKMSSAKCCSFRLGINVLNSPDSFSNSKGLNIIVMDTAICTILNLIYIIKTTYLLNDYTHGCIYIHIPLSLISPVLANNSYGKMYSFVRLQI